MSCHTLHSQSILWHRTHDRLLIPSSCHFFHSSYPTSSCLYPFSYPMQYARFLTTFFLSTPHLFHASHFLINLYHPMPLLNAYHHPHIYPLTRFLSLRSIPFMHTHFLFIYTILPTSPISSFFLPSTHLIRFMPIPTALIFINLFFLFTFYVYTTTQTHSNSSSLMLVLPLFSLPCSTPFSL